MNDTQAGVPTPSPAVAPSPFPDPLKMTPMERATELTRLRTKVLNNEQLTRAEIEYSTRLLAGTRQANASSSSAGKAKVKKAEEQKAQTKATALFGDL